MGAELSNRPPQKNAPEWRGGRDVVALVLWSLLLATLFFGIGYLFGAESDPAPIVIEKHLE